MTASVGRTTRRFRQIAESDIEGLFAVRVATGENALSREQLAGLGITAKTVLAMLGTTHRGWLCEEDGRIVGFAMGNGEKGEMWVIAVLPDHEGKGTGTELLRRVEEWLWSKGWEEIWLTTDIDITLRAYGFYRRHGWTDVGIKDGLRYLKKPNPRGKSREATAPAGGG